MVAYHTSATDIFPSTGIDDRKILHQTTKRHGGAPTHIDLAIGTRVSCVQNLETQIGNLLFTLHDKFNIYYLLSSIPVYFTQEYIIAQRVPLLVLHLQVQFPRSTPTSFYFPDNATRNSNCLRSYGPSYRILHIENG
jgi:hypothetical protein